MKTIDLNKFICSLIERGQDSIVLRHSLEDQGLEYKDSQIVPIESDSSTSKIEKGKWYKCIDNTLACFRKGRLYYSPQDNYLASNPHDDKPIQIITAFNHFRLASEEEIPYEPKFKVGDNVISDDGKIWHIIGLDNKNYQVKSTYNNETSYFPIKDQDKVHIKKVNTTIMNYEKKYKEALGRARTFARRWEGIEVTDSELALKEVREIFPELKESEDEGIRKGLLSYFQKTKIGTFNNMDANSIIAWLEKQKSVNNNAVATIKAEIERRLECFKSEKDKKATTQIDKLSLGGRIAALQELLVFINLIPQQQFVGTNFSDLKNWKYIVDAVLTEKEGIGQYLDNPEIERIAKKLQERFSNIKQKPVRMSHDDEIMIAQLTKFFTTSKGLQNTNETVVEWLRDLKDKLEHL